MTAYLRAGTFRLAAAMQSGLQQLLRRLAGCRLDRTVSKPGNLRSGGFEKVPDVLVEKLFGMLQGQAAWVATQADGETTAVL